MKRILILIMLVTILGVGPTMLRSNIFANSNFDAFGFIYFPNQGDIITSQVISETSFSSVDWEAKLIEEVNDGFRNWLLTGDLLYEAFKSILPNGWSNNDAGIEIFSKFLQENPKYAEKFSEYLEIQSRRNDLKAEQACLTDKEIEAVIKYGVLVREWNSTVEVNGTSWPCNYKEYVLEGEKTLTLLKMTIYTNETVIDPYITVNSFPLVAYIWPFGWLCFGEDWYLHIRAPYIIEYNNQVYYEAAIFVNYINTKVQQHGYVAIAIGALIAAALGAAGSPTAGAIEAAIVALVTSLMVLNFQEEANLALVIAQGAAAQGNFYGVKLLIKTHYLYSYWWLPIYNGSSITFWFIWHDGTWKNAIPELPLYGYVAYDLKSKFLTYALEVGCLGVDVWVFPYYIYA